MHVGRREGSRRDGSHGLRAILVIAFRVDLVATYLFLNIGLLVIFFLYRYLSNLYSDPDGPDVHRCNAFLRSRIENSEAIFSFKRADIYLRLLYKKYTEGFTPSVVDIFSAMLGYLFEKDTQV